MCATLQCRANQLDPPAITHRYRGPPSFRERGLSFVALLCLWGGFFGCFFAVAFEFFRGHDIYDAELDVFDVEAGHGFDFAAYSDFDYARSALQFGADDYLLKPFQDKELVAAIERIHRKEQEKSGLSVSDELPLAKGDKSRYVLEAMEYISEHYAESSINITEIAQHLGVSEGHLSHVFKKETKYTVVGYLTQYRIHMAMKLLRDSRCKVYEVAGMVGYKDVAYFGSTFKKLTGLAPSEYQDRCR